MPNQFKSPETPFKRTNTQIGIITLNKKEPVGKAGFKQFINDLRQVISK